MSEYAKKPSPKDITQMNMPHAKEESALLKTKQKAHHEMFASSVKILSLKLLNKLNKDLKKSRNTQTFKRSALALFASSLDLANEMIKLIIDTELSSKDKAEFINNYKIIIILIKSLEASLAPMSFKKLTRKEFLVVKENIIRDVVKITFLMNSAIMQSGYLGLINSVLKYTKRSKILISTMKKFNTARVSKMPLMGSEGGS